MLPAVRVRYLPSPRAGFAGRRLEGGDPPRPRPGSGSGSSRPESGCRVRRSPPGRRRPRRDPRRREVEGTTPHGRGRRSRRTLTVRAAGAMGTCSMSLRDDLAGVLARAPRYPIQAYAFVFEALEATKSVKVKSQARRRARGKGAAASRHVTGRELCEGARRLALEHYGLMALAVLRMWGIRSTSDIG